MGEFYPFPHLEHLDRYPEIFTLGRVIVTEKIHGTNARFGLVDGQFKVGGRNTELDEKNTNFGFYQWAMSGNLAQRLRNLVDDEDVIVYGEWFGPKIQKGVVYSTEKQFRGFVVRVGRTLLPVLDGHDFIRNLNLQAVPVLYDGAPHKGVFDVLRSAPSQVALSTIEAGQGLEISPWANTAEGIVIYPVYPIMNRFGDWIIAKYKDPKWEERKSQRKSEPVPDDVTQRAQAFVEEFATPTRFEHVLDALRGQGIKIYDPVSHFILREHYGAVLRALFEDIVREGKPEYDQLSKDEQRRVNKLVSEVGRRMIQEVDAMAPPAELVA